jgi:large subunit ribosomal protein L15
MMIHEITARVGRGKARKRIGRGEASGTGGTSGRGHKGAKSRSGYSRRASYEGGQKPFAQRFPKRGFSNADFRREFHVVNLKALEDRFEAGAEVDAAALVRVGLIRDTKLPVKVLAEGELSKSLKVVAARFSATAKARIEAAGGTATTAE